MTITANAGPYVSFGQAQYADYNPEAGPSLFFSGQGIMDPRMPFNYDPGQDFGAATCGWLGTTAITTLNITPPAASGVAISAAAATTGGTPVTLVSASSATTGVAVGISATNSNTGVNVTGLLALDAYTSVSGYVSNGTSGVAGNLLIITTSTTVLPIVVGMTLAGTGIPAGTTVTGYGPAIGTTASGTGFTGVYTVSGAPFAAGTSGAPITITGSQGSTVAGTDAVAACRLPFGSSGTIQMWNPQALSARAVSITPVSAAPSASITFTVSGYDIYGVPMTEVIPLTTGSTGGTAVNGKKAFKYIASVTPSGTQAVTFSVGTTNIFGLPLRSDTFGDVLIYYAASLNPVPIVSATGYVSAVTTPSTTTTGDVRGTYTNTPSIGANRFVVTQSPPLYNIGSVAGLFGVAQT